MSLRRAATPRAAGTSLTRSGASGPAVPRRQFLRWSPPCVEGVERERGTVGERIGLRVVNFQQGDDSVLLKQEPIAGDLATRSPV